MQERIRRDGPTWAPGELPTAAVRLVVGLVVVAVVFRVVRRFPWPRPFRFRFVALHLVLAPAAALIWYAVSTPLEFLVYPGGPEVQGGARLEEMLAIGSILYFIVAGVAYAAENSARAARAESAATATQLAALRAQLHPHFLFNALHTVVQLIPVDPQKAAEAAELVGDLLRAALEEKRDVVSLAEEWRFVSRYLELERIRFGERLIVRTEIPDALMSERVPSFAIQTLIENAVQHGAAPRVAPTEIVVTGARSGASIRLSVRNPANGRGNGEARAGTGLARLRERLLVLYGTAASLDSSHRGDSEYESVLTIPARGNS